MILFVLVGAHNQAPNQLLLLLVCNSPDNQERASMCKYPS